MSIMSYNGGAVMAMKGKNCMAIAADRRFGIQAQMVTTDFQIFPMGDRLYIGLAGLATDVQAVAQCLKFRLNLYELKEGQQIKPYTLMSMVANLLYEKRHRVREGEHKQRGGVEGEGGADTPLNRETDAGLDTRFWDHDLSQRQTFNRLNHPSILIIFQLSKNLSHCGFDLYFPDGQ
uniref:Proteasome component C10-II n=1 Tax=Canis lupus dingo TaxID=286419 RepID=A0A8C0KTA5_CANLU